MKLAEDKFQYKSHFATLGQSRIVHQDNTKFWNVLIDSPQSASDVFDLLSSTDIQSVRDQNLPNFFILIRVLSSRIVELSGRAVQERQRLVNCVRLLTRVLPFLFELPNYASEIELELFWEQNFDPQRFAAHSVSMSLQLRRSLFSLEDATVPAVDLLRSLVSLLFVPGFTLEQGSKLWEPGIGVSGAYKKPDHKLDINRIDILRLLLVLTSSTYYLALKEVTTQGSRFLTTLIAALPKQEITALLCSLINIVCRSARVSATDNGLNYPNTTLTELRYSCVNYSFQLLVAMVVYPMPPSDQTNFLTKYGVVTKRPSHNVRLFFSRLTKESELLFLATHFLNFLRFPIYTLKDETKRRQFRFGQPSLWALESTVMLWEIFQCNKAFAEQLGPRFIPRLVPYLVYHIFAFHDVPQHFSLIRIIAHFLLFISSLEERVKSLVITEPSIEGFPPEVRMNGVGSTRDFSVINLCQVLMNLAPATNDKGSKLHSFLRPTLIEILYNMIPTVNDAVKTEDISSRAMSNVSPKGGLSFQASKAVTQVILRYSDRSFLLQNPTHPSMLALLIRSICASATKQPSASRMILFTFLRNEKAYDHVWNVIHGLKDEALEKEALADVNEEEEDCDDADARTDNENDIGGSRNTPISDRRNSAMFSPSQNRNSFTEQDVRSPYSNSNNGSFVESGHFESNNNSRTSLNALDPNVLQAEEERILASALRPHPPTGMSQKFRDKLPITAPLSRSWGGNDALRIILTILIPNLKSKLKDIWAKRDQCNFDDFFIVKQIENSNFEEVIRKNRKDINHDFLPETPTDKLAFSWNHLALGWYLSIIDENSYKSTENLKLFIGTNSTLMKNISSSIALLGKIASSWSGFGWNNNLVDPKDEELIAYVEENMSCYNPWGESQVRIFKTGDESDRVYNPFGLKYTTPTNTSVTDLTNTLVKRLGDFRLGSRSSIISISSVPQEESERPNLLPRNSVTSLHSLNTLNRTRSNTPRNSISM